MTAMLRNHMVRSLVLSIGLTIAMLLGLSRVASAQFVDATATRT